MEFVQKPVTHQDLVDEKVRYEKAASELGKFKQLEDRLAKLGITQEVLEGQEDMLASEASAVQKLDGSMTELLEIRQNKINALEKEKSALQQNLEVLKRKVRTKKICCSFENLSAE